jgi:DNA-binding NarL/FixJ family response regulator
MARGGAGPSPTRAALVADGDGESRAVLTELLQRLGCSTTEATTGEEALAAARRESPGLVVVDVDLPGFSGYEVCRELREEFGEGLPIMLVSDCRVEPLDEVAGLLLGADDYVAKPIRTDLFLAHARRLLARSTARGSSALTPREREVLSLLVDGLRTAEIASELCISTKTVSAHIEHILSKLGAHSQAQAVALAMRDRLVGNTA